MAVLIMITSNQQAREQVRKAYRRRGKDLFLGKLAANVYVMKNDGKALMWAWKEKRRNPMFVDLYAAEELRKWQIPEDIRRAAEWKLEKGRASYPRKEETLAKENLPSMGELEKIELNFSLSSLRKR
ncbi:MAG: hypothetical protein V3U24_10335 [Candidatus Neomarinimicrobiota bacterium]